MANLPISGLPEADALDGSELAAVVQAGTTKQATTQAIADLASSGSAQALALNFNMGDSWESDSSFNAIVDEDTLSMPSPDIAFDPNSGNAQLVVTTPGVYLVTITFYIGPVGDWPEFLSVVGMKVGAEEVNVIVPALPQITGVTPGSATCTMSVLIDSNDGQGPYGIEANARFLTEMAPVAMQVRGMLTAVRIGSGA